MELINDFRVGVPVEQAYEVLADIERIAPCLPGAELQEITGEFHRGVVKVKVGPITASYEGAAIFVERTAPNRIVVRAEGRETRGQGNAVAIITATLTPDGDGTKVALATELTVTGRVAQFGRGVLADVAGKLVAQFVQCLESTVLGPPVDAPVADAPVVEAPVADEPAAEVDAPVVAAVDVEPLDGEAVEPAPAPIATAPGPVRRVDPIPVQPVGPVATAGSPAKRAAPVLGAVAVLWLLRLLLRRRRR